MTQAQTTEIQNRFIKGLTVKMLIAFIMGVISVTTSVVLGFAGLHSEVKDIHTEVKGIRYEFHSALDSMGYNQRIRQVQVDAKFQQIDDKLNHIEDNTGKK